MSRLMTYRKVGEDAYEATDGSNTVVVSKTWRRSGGAMWETPGVMNGRLAESGKTRETAAGKALARLRRELAKEMER